MNLDCAAERLRIAVVAALVAFPCFGQPPQSQAGTIRIDASVTEHGDVVTDLTQADFLIRDEGEPRSAVAFANEILPLDVVLLCEFVPVANRASKDFQFFSQMKMNISAKVLGGLRPEDRAAVISFGLDPRIEQHLTSDRDEIAAALRAIGTRSGPTVSGAQFMAIEWALRLLAKERMQGENAQRRSAIVTVSRGYPPYSPGTFNDEPAISRLWEENTVLSALFTPGTPSGVFLKTPLEPGSRNYRTDNLAHIAAETGGSTLKVPADNFPDLLARVRSSYSLWIRPVEAKPGTVRRITVELTDEAKKRHPGAEIQARKGYVVP